MFLPIEKEELNGKSVDFVFVIPEAYVDHPSFGHAIISRLIEDSGFSIALCVQPKSDKDYTKFGRPNIAFLVSGGVVDSMVNNYSVAKIKRDKDLYSEGGKAGNRPDRALTVYSKSLKRIYPQSYVIIGGIEASLRRFAHYDYWADKVMPSILVDSKADLLMYGMGERSYWDILARIKNGEKIQDIKDIGGTAYLADFNQYGRDEQAEIKEKFSFCPSFQEVSENNKQYLKAYKMQYSNSNYLSGKPLIQKQEKEVFLICNAPQKPLTIAEMDKVYSFPYEGTYHPSYKNGVPSIEEVKFSITSHRGCFGGCSYCALSYHQGREIAKRSKESIVNEAVKLSHRADFKGYIHDIGGPTANFRNPSCKIQEKIGVCKNRQCIGYEPCPNLVVDHSEYLDILRTVRELPKIKKVFIRSGIRFDYLMYDKNDEFFKELVKYHVSGQLKVAPEHNSSVVLKAMNKPEFRVYQAFYEKFKKYTNEIGMEQYLVPYLISSHPACTLEDAVSLTEYLKSIKHMPEQVQDFYPTPSTKSTTMYYTGLDMDENPIFVPKTKEEKRVQRALLQYRKEENLFLVNQAYKEVEDKKTQKFTNNTQKSRNDKFKKKK